MTHVPGYRLSGEMECWLRHVGRAKGHESSASRAVAEAQRKKKKLSPQASLREGPWILISIQSACAWTMPGQHRLHPAPPSPLQPPNGALSKDSVDGCRPTTVGLSGRLLAGTHTHTPRLEPHHTMSENWKVRDEKAVSASCNNDVKDKTKKLCNKPVMVSGGWGRKSGRWRQTPSRSGAHRPDLGWVALRRPPAGPRCCMGSCHFWPMCK